MAALTRIKHTVAWVQRLKPVRVFQAYSSRRGPILANGMSYSALFSVFAALWVLFSVAGLVISGDKALQHGLVSAISDAVPGLIDSGDGSGAVDPTALFKTTTYNITGIIALLGGLFTALGFLNSARNSIRVVYDLPPIKENVALLKVKDFAFLIGFLVIILVSTALSVAGTGATQFLLGLVGISGDSIGAVTLSRVVTLVLATAINAVAVGAMLSLLARARIRFSKLWPASLVGGVGVSVLTVLFQLGVVGGAGKNPLISSFIAILGLLIYFNFMCQAVLVAAAWLSDTVTADGSTMADKHRTPMRRGLQPGVQRPRTRRA